MSLAHICTAFRKYVSILGKQVCYQWFVFLGQLFHATVIQSLHVLRYFAAKGAPRVTIVWRSTGIPTSQVWLLGLFALAGVLLCVPRLPVVALRGQSHCFASLVDNCAAGLTDAVSW